MLNIKNKENTIPRILQQVRTKIFSLKLILGFTFLIQYNSGYAQVIQQASANDSTKVEKVIATIPLANIGTETEITVNKVREIKSSIQPSEAELKIDSLIPPKLEQFNRLKSELELEEIEYLDIKQTENLKSDFNQIRVQLDEWRSFYMGKTNEIYQMKSVLGDFKTAWEMTLNLEANEKLPKQVTERIKSNIKEVTDLENDLTIRNNTLLTKQDTLTGILIYIDEVLNTIQKNELSLRTRIFSVSSAPIWHISRGINKRESLKERVFKIVNSHNNDFKIFLESYRSNMFYHLLFFVLLLFLSYFLKNDVAKWSDEKKDEAVKTSLYVISRPISAALIVTILVSSLFYPEAPSNVLKYFYIILAWPVLRIVPGLIHGIPKKYFYIVGGLYILTQVTTYFSELVIIERTILLFIDIATIILIVTLFRNKSTVREANRKIKWDFVFTLLRICVFLLVLSIMANIIGGTVLSRILSQGSLVMIYGGAIIYASAIILIGIFALLLQHNTVSSLNIISNYSDAVKKKVFQIIKWGANLYWLYITLSGFLIYQPLYNWVEAFLIDDWVIGSIAVSIGSILAFFITLWIALTFSKFIRFILQDEILTHFELPRGVPGAISMLIRLALIGVGFILAFGAAKIDMSNMTIIFGALGVGIGFGLQNIFNNLVSGLILAFERPIQVGDVIEIATLNLMGTVKEIGLRASSVRTFDGAEVIVPNGNLISNEVINWTLSDHLRRQEIIVGVAYGSDTNKVLNILESVVSEQDDILKIPNHLIIFQGFGESSLNFRVLFWTVFEDGLSIKSAVGLAIDMAFKKEGIEIPFPQRDIHLRTVSDEVDITKISKPDQLISKPKHSTKSEEKGLGEDSM